MFRCFQVSKWLDVFSKSVLFSVNNAPSIYYTNCKWPCGLESVDWFSLPSASALRSFIFSTESRLTYSVRVDRRLMDLNWTLDTTLFQYIINNFITAISHMVREHFLVYLPVIFLLSSTALLPNPRPNFLIYISEITRNATLSFLVVQSYAVLVIRMRASQFTSIYSPNSAATTHVFGLTICLNHLLPPSLQSFS